MYTKYVDTILRYPETLTIHLHDHARVHSFALWLRRRWKSIGLMVGIGVVTLFKNWLEIRHSALVLEAGGQPVTMVVSRTVIRDILQSMNE